MITDRKTPTFDDEPWFPKSLRLLCPCCGSNEIHQFQYEIFQRREDKGEDDDYTLYTAIDHWGDVIKPSFENPSDRRNGIRIFFWCEHCWETPSLVLFQHKGSENMQWHIHSKKTNHKNRDLDKNGDFYDTPKN
jgi:hypothetical protein